MPATIEPPDGSVSSMLLPVELLREALQLRRPIGVDDRGTKSSTRSVSSLGRGLKEIADELGRSYLKSLSDGELQALLRSVRTLPDGTQGVEISWVIAKDGTLRLVNEREPEGAVDYVDALNTLSAFNAEQDAAALDFEARRHAADAEFNRILLTLTPLTAEGSA